MPIYTFNNKSNQFHLIGRLQITGILWHILFQRSNMFCYYVNTSGLKSPYVTV